MSDLAPLLQGFFTDKLMLQRQASPNTVAAYRDTFTLLLGFVHIRTGRHPAQLSVADLDAPTIGEFLHHLETSRGNTASTRNARLAAIHSFFHYAVLRAPEHTALIQRVLSIPPKRFDRAIVNFLTRSETDALIAAPDKSSWTGRRDHALLLVAIRTGLRVSELINLKLHDAQLGTGAHVRCHGKGRKDRCTPFDQFHRQGSALLAARTRRPRQRPAIPHPSRHPTVPRRRRPAGHQTHPGRRSDLSFVDRQEDHAAHVATLDRDGTPTCRRGHHGDRPMARTRID